MCGAHFSDLRIVTMATGTCVVTMTTGTYPLMLLIADRPINIVKSNFIGYFLIFHIYLFCLFFM